jgi:hypothetical protein
MSPQSSGRKLIVGLPLTPSSWSTGGLADAPVGKFALWNWPPSAQKPELSLTMVALFADDQPEQLVERRVRLVAQGREAVADRAAPGPSRRGCGGRRRRRLHDVRQRGGGLVRQARWLTTLSNHVATSGPAFWVFTDFKCVSRLTGQRAVHGPECSP